MNDEKKYTERDLAIARRGAFVSGAHYRDLYCACSVRKVCGAEDEAKARFPLPKVTRPRVATIGGYAFRVVDGRLEWNGGLAGGACWYREDGTSAGGHAPNYLGIQPTAARVRIWADLFANPTEEVEDGAA